VNASRFIADHMLGRLARWLRICGYDTVFSPAYDDADIVRIALREGRVILTRDRGLVARAAARNFIFIESQEHTEQLRQVFDALKLKPDVERVFTICPVCNRNVVAVAKDEVSGLVPPYVYLRQDVYSKCPGCRRIFWRGTHYERALEKLRVIFGRF
jgi:uncharacterized protein with PIN domain